MTTHDPNAVSIELTRALRERAVDVGGEDELYRHILQVAVARRQRRPFDVLSRRTVLLIAAAFLGVAVVGAGIGGRPATRPAPVPFPTLRNGAILVADAGTTTWIDSTTGATVGDGELPRLPTGTDAAAWSRDGRQLAVVVNGDLEIIDAGTGDRRVLARCPELGWACMVEGERPRSFDWSPDGTTIIFSKVGGLDRIDVATGRITAVVDDIGDRISSPSWSPDGLWIAFQYDVPYAGRQMGVRREVQLVRGDGSRRRSLTGPSVPESIGFYQPVWSPDGTRILYVGSDPWDASEAAGAGGWHVRLMAIDLDGVDPIGPPVSLIDLGQRWCLGFCPSVTLAPDGSSVLIDDGDDLVIARLDGTDRRALGVNARPMAWQPVP